MDRTTIRLGDLILSEKNMRRSEGDVADLAANIIVHGVLQNLCVEPIKGRRTKKKTATHAVVAGGRRLRALNALMAAGVIDADFPVPVGVCSAEEAEGITLAENYVRLPPHPADIYSAFHALSMTGLTVAQIGERFQIAPVRVERTLRLATVSPRLFELFRADKLDMKQMMALTLTQDHAVQESVALARGEDNIPQPWQIRQALTSGEIDTKNNPCVAFVGLDAYEAAGGVVRRDLFAEDGGGFISDSGLLERLALDKLSLAVTEIEAAEGWAWVEARTELAYHEEERFGRAYAETVMSGEDSAAHEAKSAELEAAYAGLEDDDEAGSAAIDSLEAELEEISGRAVEAFTEVQKANAGAIVTISRDGQLTVRRGLVRPEDKKALAAAEGKTRGLTVVQGGREGEPKADLSAALLSNLTAQRTMGMRVALTQRPDVALVVATHSLLLLTHYAGAHGAAGHSPLTLTGRTWQTPTLASHGDDITTGAAGVAMEAVRTQIAADLPEDEAELFDHLLDQTPAKVMELLAYATAESFNAVRSPHDGAAKRIATVDQVATAIGFDPAAYWTPTADNYFGKVSKTQTLDAIATADPQAGDDQLAKMKRGDLADEAERRLAGKGWVPAVMRASEPQEGRQEAEDASGDDGGGGGEGSRLAASPGPGGDSRPNLFPFWSPTMPAPCAETVRVGPIRAPQARFRRGGVRL